jgi:hypothetical protein
MIKLIVSALGFVFVFETCTKEKKNNDNERLCPTVMAVLVPQIVKDSFAVKYPSVSVITWFQNDSIGYCAYFLQSGNIRKLAKFTTTGVFVLEEIDVDNNGDFEDTTGNSNPKKPGECECEISE